MITIDESLYIGKGWHKKTYLHPNDPNKCIKIVYRLPMDDVTRELTYRQILQNHGLELPMLTNYYGTVETDQGLGYVYEFVRDYNGKPSQSVQSILDQARQCPSSENIALQERVLATFKKQLFKDLVFITDLDPDNFMVQWTGPDTFQIRCIDNIGPHSKYSLNLYFPSLLRRRLQKKWNHFIKSLTSSKTKTDIKANTIFSHSNFSYTEFFKGNTLLVIVPHEADEIAAAGPTIYGAIQEGMRVICVFMSNKDDIYEGHVSLEEAITMSGKLGLSDENIVFLGFSNSDLKKLYATYASNQIKTTLPLQHTKTYGLPTHKDFPSILRGHSVDTSYENLLLYLQEVILHYQPDAIISTDDATTEEYRVSSLVLERALSHLIQSKKLNKLPKVFKTFPCANPTLAWEDRIRIAVPDACCKENWMDTPIYKALSSYVSQNATSHINRLVTKEALLWNYSPLPITESKGAQADVSELKVIKDATPYAYIHITMNDQFAYDLTLYPGQPTPHIGVYCQGLQANELEWTVNGTPVDYKDLQAIFKGNLQTYTIRCQSKDGLIWSQIKVHKASLLDACKHYLQALKIYLSYQRNQWRMRQKAGAIKKYRL